MLPDFSYITSEIFNVPKNLPLAVTIQNASTQKKLQTNNK